jgi:hypothetical protein
MKKSITLLVGLACFALIFSSCTKTELKSSSSAADSAFQKSSTTRLSSLATGSLLVESLNGPITTNEITAFKSYMASVSAPATNDQNIWVYGNSGKQIEACGLMYEATGDQTILDRMIYYCDAALAGRNDLASAANGGQRTVWTGNIEPVWPSSDATVIPAQAGIEQGDVLSHMAYCAKLILQHPAIWSTTVGIGDPDGFGATYKARALKYIQQGDYVIDKWILPHFIKTSESNHFYFPGSPNTYKPNEPAPWNQLFMLTDGMIRLVQCHVILADSAARVTKYDGIIQPNITWFRANLTSNTSASGSACWDWAYQLPSGTEDSNHFAYEAEGLWLAYNSGRYGVSLSNLVPFANTYFDIILATVTGGVYAGRVDGTTGTGNSGGDNYVRDEYIYLADVRPEKYATVGNIEITQNKIASSPQITGRLLWLKNRRYTSMVSLFQNNSYAGWQASFGVGNYLEADLIANGGINDDASSIIVPAGLKVTVYTGNNYTGTAKTYTANTSSLTADGINDQISSLKVTTNP